MEPALNPYSPGSGLQPPFLAGREKEIEAFDLLLARTRAGHQSRGMILSGLRGVGKTVLLNRLRGMARHHEWLEIKLEGRPGASGQLDVRRTLARELQRAARKYTLASYASGKMTQALQTITSFSFGIGVEGLSLGVERDPTRAGTGQIDVDLRDLVEDVAAAMRSLRLGFVIFLDEMQDVDDELLSALVTAQHHAGQEELPFYIVGAGLPNLPARLADARSYAERLFDYRTIGTLRQQEAIDSFQIPAGRTGQSYQDEALAVLIEVSGRYPYFIQEFGSAMWEVADKSPFTEKHAREASKLGLERLDAGFFPSRWDRATPRERDYLAAMAQDHGLDSSSAAVAERMGTTIQSMGPTRAQLISKGLVYSPEHGKVAFTVPGMAAYIERNRDS
ncbi:AAA family ATPase [Arthrobacter citreus]|uniref:AAA family ATPase n=1 Tax=Arthrobacter citreus TaxID=1670 RepID=UPI003804DE2D